MKEDKDAHRRNPDFCSKCGGPCYFDDEGKRVINNQGIEPEENEMILDALKPKTQEKKRRDPDHEQMNLF